MSCSVCAEKDKEIAALRATVWELSEFCGELAKRKDWALLSVAEVRHKLAGILFVRPLIEELKCLKP